ncbi:Hpt domain-containing protein [Alkalilimnicola ehrlichii MLHE-1]|uniref:Chemotaxis protein CheA n=1 Tax=Alkalilimnicola ehrlichii (strain ATCC BAA-1101 / DSM 17681 / MLHE-1) TaxID=187272 RepID=Q0ABS3_ALKEH|nr:Hpt domain-containing protein [Alkalilimnicola ehrlichii]ABI55714.1 CheA signal transduction histidine kinase [Alkalilimnicola ehrlichii MLHE-1]
MTDSAAIHRSGLGWVRHELREALRQAADALECASEDREAVDDLEASLEALRHVRGVLALLGLEGGQRLVEAMEQLTSRLLDEAIAEPAPAQEALMGALLQLPDYLEQVQSGRLRDHPVHLLGLINRLRQAGGEPPLSASAWFRPDPAADGGEDQRAHEGEPGGERLAAAARRLRAPYQRALLGVLRAEQPQADLGRLRAVLDELDRACTDDQQGALWWIAGGVVEALEQGLLTLDQSLRLLLGRVDRELRRVADTGQDDQGGEARAGLLRELLYHIARARPETERLRAIAERYRLEEQLPPATEAGPQGLNGEVMEAVAGVLREEIASAKDALDLFARSNGEDTERLDSLQTLLEPLAHTLDTLGLEPAVREVREQMATVDAIRGGERPADEGSLDQVARALLYVEAALQGRVEHITGAGPARAATRVQAPGEAPGETEQTVFEAEYRQALAQALDEALNGFERIEQALTRYIDNADHDALREAGDSLEEVGGLLRVVGLERADAALRRLVQAIRDGLAPAEAGLLEPLAEAVTGLEYHLQGIAEDRADRDAALAVAEAAAERLSEAVPATGAVDEAAAETGGEPVGPPDAETAADTAPAPEEEAPAADIPVTEEPIEAEPIGAEPAAEEPAAEAPATEGPASAPPAATRQQAGTPDPQVPALAEDSDPEIVEIYLEEVGDLAGPLRESFQRWHRNPDDHDALVETRRAFHTLKGSGRLAGALLMGEMAWAVENLLNRVTAGKLTPGPDLFAVVAEALDHLPGLVAHLRDGTAPPAGVRPLIRRAAVLADPALDDWLPPVAAEPAPVVPPSEEALAESGSEAEEEEPETAVSDEPREPTEPTEAAAPQEQDVDPALLEIFHTESETHLATVREFVGRCHTEGQCEIGQGLNRALHTLVGSARTAGIDGMARLGRALETLARHRMELRQPLSPAEVDAFSRGVDLLHRYVEGAGVASAEQPDDEADELIRELADLEAESAAGSAMELDDEEAARRWTASDGMDPDLVALFTEEAEDLLGFLETTIHDWASGAGGEGALREVHRSLHTLKGGARLAGFRAIGDLCHALESRAAEVAGAPQSADAAYFSLLNAGLDRLAEMTEEVKQGYWPQADEALLRRVRGEGPASPQAEAPETEAPQAEEPATQLPEPEEPEAETAGPAPVEAPQPPAPEPTVETAEPPPPAEPLADEAPVYEAESTPPEPEAAERAGEQPRVAHQDAVRVRAELLDQLVSYAGEVSIVRARLEQNSGALRFNLNELDETVNRLRRQLRDLEIETEAQILYRFNRDQEDARRAEFDPLELDRFSHIQELSRALAESVSDLSNLEEMLGYLARESESLLTDQARLNAQVQDGLMRTRMVPFANLLPRLRRIMRQTAQELGRKAELKLLGSQGELDRTVLERLTPPLEHMLRNALSHGIEPPEERRAAGKAETGTVSLDVYREGADIVVTVSDDGRGIDPDAIRAKAEAAGLVRPDDSLSRKQALRLILASGLSTAESLTQVAGRGVGMDVVDTAIRELGGNLEIESEPGAGSTFTIRLPFTLAINHALLCEVGDQVYAIPLSSIEGVARMDRQEALQQLADPEGARYEFAGQRYDLRSLQVLLGGGRAQWPAGGRPVHLLLVNAGRRRLALQVDAIRGNQEIVVKSVGPQISAVPGIYGATVMADGRVILILDVSALARMDAEQAAVPHWLPEAEAVPERDTERPLVMVVDDSITMRKVATRLLERNHMDVVTARDGMEALTRLEQQVPDVMLLDIEMPRMDGFELATHMRNQPEFSEVPIIMITSRVGDKHRRRAEDIGVQRYMGKPYQESELLAAIRELVEGRRPQDEEERPS